MGSSDNCIDIYSESNINTDTSDIQCEKLISEDTINKLVAKIDSDDKEESINENLDIMLNIVDKLSDKFLPKIEEMFKDRNINGEVYANLASKTIDSILRSAPNVFNSLIYDTANETTLDKLYKITQINSGNYQSCKVQKEIELVEEQRILAAFEASEEVMKLKYLTMQNNALHSEEQVKNIRAQTRLVLKQKDGFRIDAKVKMLGVLMDGWKVAFSSGLLENIPAIIDQDVIATLYQDLELSAHRFDGGSFKQDIKIDSINDNGDDVTINFSWDSGKEGDVTINVLSNYDNVTGYPIIKDSKSSASVTVKKPEGELNGTITIVAYQEYKASPDETDDSECCDISCPLNTIITSQATVRIKPI